MNIKEERDRKKGKVGSDLEEIRISNEKLDLSLRKFEFRRKSWICVGRINNF